MRGEPGVGRVPSNKPGTAVTGGPTPAGSPTASRQHHLPLPRLAGTQAGMTAAPRTPSAAGRPAGKDTATPGPSERRQAGRRRRRELSPFLLTGIISVAVPEPASPKPTPCCAGPLLPLPPPPLSVEDAALALAAVTGASRAPRSPQRAEGRGEGGGSGRVPNPLPPQRGGGGGLAAAFLPCLLPSALPARLRAAPPGVNRRHRLIGRGGKSRGRGGGRRAHGPRGEGAGVGVRERCASAHFGTARDRGRYAGPGLGP
ncbi:translation initiation factor IF-2 [Heliangelus exortis]|uniref:translation initiation factor IF-2 n=1 Tax=Heliangelus exortis TaxID=472823 RepID=UPI003A92CC01